MKRVKCTLSYDGTNFHGYQVQVNKRTVQAELEQALQKLHKGEHIKTVASGRTDAGVHAYGQVVHFDSSLYIPTDRWPYALNAVLPDDIVVKKAELVNDDFHARFSVEKKEYRYIIHRSKQVDVFRRLYSYHYPYPLDINKIKEAMKLFQGTHDFTSFCSARTEVENKVRTIYEMDCIENGDELVFTLVGNGFLYNMVRIIVGTLLEVGQGKITPDSITDIIKAQNREKAGKTVPGHGLYLWKVYY